MAKPWKEIEDSYQSSSSIKPNKIFAWYVYLNGVGTRYNKVTDIPVKYRKIAIREETPESKQAIQTWKTTEASMPNANALWKASLRNDYLYLSNSQFDYILNYVESKHPEDYDTQANYFYELVTLFQNVSVKK